MPQEIESDDPIRIITLTSAAPVHIRDRDWPIVAEVAEHAVWIKVRVHPDGRAIAYGGRLIGNCPMRGGELVEPDGDVVGAIVKLARLLGAPKHLVGGLILKLANRDRT